MATSGSTDFNVTTNELLKSSMRVAGILSEGETPSSEQLNDARQSLNMILKSWQAQGIHLWKYNEITVFPEKSKSSFTIGPNGDRAALSSDVAQTTLSASGSSGDSTIDVSSVTGIAASDNIGIELDDGTMQWTTVSSISSTTITLGSSLIGDAASGNFVYAYTTIAPRPLKVLNARRKESDQTDIPISVISRQGYFDLPEKSQNGDPTQIYYSPVLDNGILYVWQPFDSLRQRIEITVQLQLEDYDSSTDTSDLPQEWLRAIKYALAFDLCDEYGVDDGTYARIGRKSELYLDQVLGYDMEEASIYFQPGEHPYQSGR